MHVSVDDANVSRETSASVVPKVLWSDAPSKIQFQNSLVK
jgi:hypothetical protein